MCDLSSGAERSEVDLAVDHDAATYAGAKGDSYQRPVGTPGADCSLGQYESAGIVDERGWNAQRLSHRIAQWMAGPRTGKIREQNDPPGIGLE